MSNHRKNLIVTLADANFINQAKQLFSSVYFNAGWEGDYLLLSNGISEDDLNWFRNKGILIYDAPLLDNSRQGGKTYPSIVLSKFYLFKEYFKQWNKIIFLDADIIVRAPLNDLLLRDGFNAPNATTFRLKNEFINDKKKNKVIRKKYNLRARAFCSGIMVFDTRLISKNTYAEILALYNKYLGLHQIGEESTLNLFFYKKWNMLPLIYNFIPDHMDFAYGIRGEKKYAVIIHFVCAVVKPWNSKSIYYEEWLRNLKRAEEIDLADRPSVAAIFSNKEMIQYLIYLRARRVYYFLFGTKSLIKKIQRSINRRIGLCGIYINKKKPGLYERLVKFKKMIF